MEENTMKAEELRIGNFLDRSGLMEVVGIKIHAIKIYDHYNKIANPTWFQPEGFNGIQLTPEWLERFGFEFDHDGAYNETIYIKGLPKPPFLWGVYPSELGGGYVVKNSTGLHYVHQLQNLYFALTGNELILK